MVIDISLGCTVVMSLLTGFAVLCGMIAFTRTVKS